MSPSNHDLLQKANGAVHALDKMTSQERQSRPTQTYVEEYNRLRRLALDTHDDLDDLVPPEVEVDEDDGPEATYVELHSYYKELENLLGARRSMGPF